MTRLALAHKKEKRRKFSPRRKSQLKSKKTARSLPVDNDRNHQQPQPRSPSRSGLPVCSPGLRSRGSHPHRHSKWLRSGRPSALRNTLPGNIRFPDILDNKSQALAWNWAVCCLRQRETDLFFFISIADVTRRAVATSSQFVAPTALDVPPRTRPSRDSPSVTWLNLPPSVRFTLYKASQDLSTALPKETNLGAGGHILQLRVLMYPD